MINIKLYEEVSQNTITKVLSNEYDKILNILKVNKLYSVKSTRFYNLSIELQKILNNKFINSNYFKLQITETECNKIILNREQKEINQKELSKMKKLIPNFFIFDYIINDDDIYLYIYFESKNEIFNDSDFFYNKWKKIKKIEKIKDEDESNIQLFSIFIKKIEDDYYLVIVNDIYYLKLDQFIMVQKFLNFLFK